jgi:hypothetical protein
MQRRRDLRTRVGDEEFMGGCVLAIKSSEAFEIVTEVS